MVEKFLAEIYHKLRSNQVAIIIDGESLSSDMLTDLITLREKVKELGVIRVAEVFFENKVSKSNFEDLRESGFTDIIVPGNIELNFLLEVYDLVLGEKIDFVIIGTHREELIPLFTEIRKSVTVFGLIESKKKVSKAFLESFDDIIEVGKIKEYVFNSAQFSELDQLLQNANENGNADNNENGDTISDYTGDVESVVDETNIGTFSEDLIEDDEMIEEMKKEQSDVQNNSSQNN